MCALIILITGMAFIADDSLALQNDAHYLNVIIPEQDTIVVDLPRYRIAANTNPASKAYINNREVRVYPTGAFVGMVNLGVGENDVTLKSISETGDTLARKFILERPKPLESSPTDQLVIEDIMMEPAQDRWLDVGDILEVKFKGSPGNEASFDIEGVERRIPMRELPPSETGGIEGIYVGTYEVKQEDFVQDVPIRFRLRESFWSRTEAESRGRVSIIPELFPIIGEVTGTRPFLNTGLGTDRLGGARLGFLKPGVLVQINGRIGNMYRVRLSNEMTAWIPFRFVDLLDIHTPIPQALAGSISTSATNTLDIVTLQIGEKLPYVTRQELHPNRIVVDIYGATSNTTWVTQHLAAEGIRNITWEQVSAEKYRLKIEIDHTNHWGHRVEYTDRGDMRVIIRRPPRIDPDEPLRGRVIAVDAGHGGNNRGALGATGALEKDVTLAISKFMEEMLKEHGAHVVMTRTGDYDVSMQQRVDTVLSSNADMVISIHCNSIGYATDPERIRGTSTYYTHVGFKPLADITYKHLLKLGFDQFGVIGSFNFLLNDMIEIPNVLIETGFISNPLEEQRLLDQEVQTEISQKLVDAIKEYLIEYGDI